MGWGISLNPIDIERDTLSNKAGVEVEKDRGAAPAGSKVVKYGVYALPFTINPNGITAAGCTAKDVNLFLNTLWETYSATISATRPEIALRHIWVGIHKGKFTSCNETELRKLLTPKRLVPIDTPAQSWEDYEDVKLEDIADNPMLKNVTVYDLAMPECWVEE